MKAALVLRGGAKVPSLVRATNLGITRLYWEAEDPQLDGPLLAAVRAKGFQVGIMRDPHWHDDSPAVLASKLSSDLVRLGTTNKQCAVIADIEVHSPRYVLDFIHAWRVVRPTRETSWTLEGFQGGWFSPELVNAINADVNIMVIPQAYTGNMTPQDLDQVRADTLVRGINCARYRAFYPRLPGNGYWDGIAYDLAQIQVV